MQKVLGIDLGTTNSVVAVIEGTQPTVIPNNNGLRTTPSVVAYTKKGDLLVGQLAKRQAVINYDNTFYSVKRFIGTNPKDLTPDLKEVSYTLIEEADSFKINCTNLKKTFTPEEISAQILRKLAGDAETYLGNPVKQAVITVPAYFNDTQRQATKDAGKIGGLEVLRIINEPTAASLAYGLDKKENELILVFDLGGGTFDVSILEVGDGIFEVLSTSGDTRLGGDNFDKVIVNNLLEEFEKAEGISLKGDNQALQRLNEAAEKAKIELSTLNETTINLPFITGTETGPKHIETKLTRELFEKLAEKLIQDCRIPVEQSLKDARLDKAKLDQVVLVGGSTRIPAIRELVKSLTGKVPNQSVNPDEVVAIGAAVQGGVLSGEVRDILLLDVTPLSLGVETLGGVMTKIIGRNTTVPTKKSEFFSTSQDNQTSVQIHVLQGEREFATDNKSLGDFKLDGIAPAPRNVPKIEVTFDIDVNGILTVRAQDSKTGLETSIVIEGSSKLSDSDIDRMVQEAEGFAKEDKKRRELIQLKNDADLLIYNTNKQIEDLDNSTLENQKDKILELKSLLNDLSDVVQKEDVSQIEDYMKKIQSISGNLNNAMNESTPSETETVDI
jgi:chaperone protein DnaK